MAFRLLSIQGMEADAMNRRILAIAVFVFALAACGPQPEYDGPPLPSMLVQDLHVGPAAQGVDRAGAISVSEAQSFKRQYGAQWAGAYIGGACNGGSGWTPGLLTDINRATGWQFMPIYVGSQDEPGICVATLSSGQGTHDGHDATSILRDQYHWPAHENVPVVLDLEAGTYGNDPGGSSAYVRAWVNAVHADGYLAYVYSNPDALIGLAHDGIPIDAAWVANWVSSCFDGHLAPAGDSSLPDNLYKNRAWQYTDCGGSLDMDVGNLMLAPAPGKGNGSGSGAQSISPLNQVGGNHGLTAISWQDGHIEVFAATSSGRVLHAWTKGDTQTWERASDLSGGGQCGLAADVSYARGEEAEVFDEGRPEHDTWAAFHDSKGWTSFRDFSGKNIEQLASVRWRDDGTSPEKDGRTEVFGLAMGDKQIYHKWYVVKEKRWSDWSGMGGSFATGPSAILDAHGDAVVFATNEKGEAYWRHSHDSNGDGWTGWNGLGGTLSTRPVPVRDPNGTIRLFARAQDGHLVYAYSTDHGYTHWETLGRDLLAGEPTAAVDDGHVMVFFRGTNGNYYGATMDEKTHKFGSFNERPGGPFASDPFLWERPDGRVELFGTTKGGHLVGTYKGKSGWEGWKSLATGIEACPAPLVLPECPGGHDGYFCGGHGISGKSSDLYECRADSTGVKLTLVESCSSGCEDIDQGGDDRCRPETSATACSTDADCGSVGACSVCVQTTQVCGGMGPSYCSNAPADVLGMTCTQDSDCDPCNTGLIVCGSTGDPGCGGKRCVENIQ